MGSVRVVDVFPFSQRAVDLGQSSGEFGDLVEPLAVSPVGAFDVAVELRRARGRTNNWTPRSRQASSNSAMNSEPPST